MQDNYIKAIVDLIQSGLSIETVLQNTKQIMTQKGHVARYGAVLRGVLLTLTQQEQSHTATVKVARVEDVKTEQVRIALKMIGGDNHDYSIVVDSTIVGGVIVKYHNNQLDLSYKTKLKTLYQSVIS